jgi:hypothetical protein
VLEYGRAVVVEVFAEPDGVRGLAEQFRQSLLAFEQREVAQVTAVMLDQIERKQHSVGCAAR